MDFAIFGDIIFFALLAGYIWFKLRATLGRKDDATPPVRPVRSASKPEERAPGFMGFAPVQPKEKIIEAAPVRAYKEPEIKDAGISAVLKKIQQKDASFTPGYFVEGASMAFEMVLDAYSKGDDKTLKTLLSAPLYKEFTDGIAARKAAGETLETTLVALNQVEIIAASFDKNIAEIRARFVSEQISVTTDSQGKVVDGDASRIEKVTDEWAFRRDVTSSNPNWIIIET
jgi:predicted lipid-binding transport protein (Tim44 family)